MNRKFLTFIGVFIGCSLIGLLVYGLFFASNPREIPSVLIGKKAEPFTTTTFNGREISLQEFRGRPIVLNFWASWCIACRQEAHILEAAHQTYTPKGAVFIGIAINDTREASLGFIRRYGKTYLLAPDDDLGSIALDYGVTAVPETFLIDGQGIITDKVLGAVNQNTLDDFLRKELNL